MKNKKLLKTLEREINIYVALHSNKSIKGFISRIFGYLRKNITLLKNENYNKLYYECLTLLNWIDRKIIKKSNNKNLYEIVIDLMNREKNFYFNKEIVDKYLDFRKKSWDTGYFDKLFETL